MAGRDFSAHLAGLTAKETKDGNEIELKIAIAHETLEASLLFGWLAEVKRIGKRVLITVEAGEDTFQIGLWDSASSAIETEMRALDTDEDEEQAVTQQPVEDDALPVLEDPAWAHPDATVADEAGKALGKVKATV